MKFDNITVLGLLSYLSDKTKLKILSIVILLPIACMIATLVYGYETINADYSSYRRSMDFIDDTKVFMLQNMIRNNYNKSKVQTEMVKNNILKDLYIEYGQDYDAMKQDFLTRDYKNRFYHILSNNITDIYDEDNKSNNNGRIFIADKYGVLVDNSFSHYKNSFTDWDDIIEGSYNPDMIKKAVVSITNQENRILLINDTVMDTSDLEEDMSLDYKAIVKKYIDKNELDKLGNYSLITVSYIHDTRDIFGVRDMQAGHVISNNKLYVIKVIKLKDILNTDPDIVKYINDYNVMGDYGNEFINSIKETRIFIILLIIILQITTFFGIWYLSEFYVYTKFSTRKDELSDSLITLDKIYKDKI